MDPQSRRRWLHTLAGAAAVGLAGCREMGPGGHTATATDTATPTATLPPVDGPTRWTVEFDTDEQPTAPGAGQFVSVGVGSSVRTYTAGGEEVWSVDLDDQVQTVAVADGTVFATSGQRGLGGGAGSLTAVVEATGKRLWTREFGGGIKWWGGADGTVYIGSVDDLAGDRETLFALDVADGDDRWETTLSEPKNLVHDGSTLVVGAADGVYRIDPDDGTVRWHAEFTYAFATLVVGPETVAAVEEGESLDRDLVVLDRRGEVRWGTEDWVVVGLTFHDGRLFAGGERIAAYDPVDPDPEWTVESGGYLYHAPAFDGAIVAGWDGFRAYDVDAGTERWAYEPDGADPTPKVAHRRTVYGRTPVADDRRHAYAVDATDGSERWTLTAEGELSDFAVGRRGCYLTDSAGFLHSLA